jgi:hypothetical protein
MTCPRTSIGGTSDISAVFNSRISNVEQENEELRKELRRCVDSFTGFTQEF